ncbi:MAG: SufD family Fe-S cluster assembly protein [Paludibacteraceae bacterium]|nr:SufD family Fe-S cluster assembly protein [Paludibacteraceae bacterium]
MLHNPTPHIIPAGETRELVLLNELNAQYHFIQEEGSTLRLHILCLSDATSSDEQWQASITVEQNATNCRTELYGMGLLHGTQQAHIHTNVLHNIGGGYSSQLFKFVLDEQSRGSFRGELKILPDAQQTEAYQTNRNILLSRQAEMLTEPQLEIYADDVKASHGATTGQLDESALFYMQQRCIDRDTAAKLLLCAFFDEVLKTLSDTELQEKLVEKINNIL